MTLNVHGYRRDDCIRSVVALVMALQDGGALAEDVIAALEVAIRCESRLRQHAFDTMIDKITLEKVSNSDVPSWCC